MTIPTGYTSTVVDANDGNLLINNSHTPETTTLSGTKTWDDANNQDGVRPSLVDINLFADGIKVAETQATAASGWTYEFNDLPVYRAGQLIDYTITEDFVAGYLTTIDGFDIINSREVNTIDIQVSKRWFDSNDQDGLRPESIQVQLLANGIGVGLPITLTSNGNWRHTWTGLAENASGLPITYSVVELITPVGYESEVSGVENGIITVSNAHSPATVDVLGTKTWDDANNQDGMRPEEVTINLLANNVIIDSQVINEAGGWSYSFTRLPEFEAGSRITYTVSENHVSGYSSIVDGFDIVNQRTPDVVSFSVFKSWLDNNDQDGIRPETILVQLLADGVALGTPVTLTATSGWTYRWTGLPENQDGSRIDYNVEELNVPASYTSVVTDNDDGNLLITNSYTPETTTVSGTKTWNDNDNQDGIRPSSIIVNLYADNVEVSSRLVTATGGWAYTFANLPVFKDGVRINYTVTEDYVPGYSPVVNGFNITNNHTPDEASVSVFKSWLDQNDQDGIRPESVQVQLLADGVATGTPITLTSTSGWTYTWSGLPVNQDGSRIDYNVEEINVPSGYTSIVTDNNDGNFMMTNSYTPEITTVSGAKTWNDNDNQDGLRPDTITVRLFADNIEVGRQEVTATGGWTYSFTNLPVFKDGVRISYRVAEDYIPGYSPIVNGFDITNNHTPDEASITVFKSWLDQNNQDGIRPESIQVQLLADGVATGTPITLTSTTGWTYTWTGLPVNQDGSRIDYNVEELNVPSDYTSIVTDNNDGNLLMTNSYTPQTTTISGTNSWNDNDNQDGIRPDEITVRLFADNVEVGRRTVTATGGWTYSFTNLPVFKDGVRISYRVAEDYIPDYSPVVNGFDITNNHTPDEASITVFKSWLDQNDQDGLRPESVQVQLLADGVATGTPITLTSTTGWTYTWSGLPVNQDGSRIDYSVVEVNVPTGYTSIVTDNNDGNLLMTNSYTPQTTIISGTKSWNDNNNQDGLRPDEITVRLFADNIEVARQEVTATGGWTYSFTNLPVFKDGVRISYRVAEDYIPGYSPVVNGFDITNNHTPDEASITVFKSWLDLNNQDGIRPESVQVQLLADGISSGTPVTLTSTTGWTYTWSGLPVNQEGSRIDYSVVEVNVPTGYTSIVTDNNDGNLLMTNSYTPQTTTISGTKSWDDNNNQDGIRPDAITVKLFANNVEVGRQEVTEAAGWAYSFTNLPVYANGQAIDYTVTEDYVPGYSNSVDGFDIYNSRTPDEVSISVFKSWLDQNNQDGIRPESVQVQLLADGISSGTPITLTSTSGWSYTWTGLPENTSGTAIDYSVVEVNVPTGYTSIVTDNNDGNLLMTNSYTPETRTIQGTKTWNDNDNQDGIRPDTITVKLFANNVEVGRQAVTEADGWAYSFTNLPVYANGQAIAYTVTEDYIPGYSPVVNGFDITNNHTPDEASITVFKSWLDRNNQDGLRPESVQVQLLADGISSGTPVTLTSTTGWTYTWSGLPVNQDGSRIDYSVVEVNVPAGYTSIVTDNDDGNLLMTNSYTPETTTIQGTKSWNDNNNQDGIRPDTITVRLFANNVEVGRQDVTDAAGWTYSFTNLPVYANGQAIDYTVTEDYVRDYSPVINGFDITNNHTPDEVSISVFKSWLDRNNQDGIRPESVQVQLLADGLAIGTPVTLTSTSGWTYTWTGLPENNSGTPIDYSVVEVNVPAGYTSIVTDNNDGNLLMTNSYTPETTTIEGLKSWNDNDNQDGIRPDTITVRLFANNVEVGRQDVTDAAGWAYSFTNLPVYANGQAIDYTITEDYVRDYSPVVTGYDIMNNHTPDEVSISVFKSWLDQNNQDGIRPESIQVQLLADGVATGTPITLTLTSGWTYTWTGLPENNAGTPIDYSAVEVNVPTGYTSIVTDNDDGNLLMTNSYTPETTTITGEKTWNDNDNQDGIRPDTITIKLFADNVEVARQEVTATGGWTYSFTNLPVFANGQAIDYRVTEDYVPGYSPVINGFDITNNHTPDEVSISVFKSWLDQNNQDGIRPESVQVQLLADGVATGGPITLTSTTGWTYTWSGLPVNQDGSRIDYSVEEVNIPTGYTSIVTDNNDGNLLMTNSYTPATTSVEGMKTWNDNDNQDGIRPDTITVRLFANNVEVGRQEVTEAAGWAYSFTNLPVFANGQEIDYTVTEDYVRDYSPVINGFDITNNHTPDEASITVFKSWLDQNDQDGIRPESVQVQLLADGDATGTPVTLTSTTGWTYTWSGLPVNQDGSRIDYSVVEVNVPTGYTSIVTDNDDGNLLMTNSYTPETTTIEGMKSWNDNDNQDGIRPDTITVKLFADNVEVARQAVTEATGWAYSFTNLPVYANGQAIDYRVTEDYVPGYSPVVTGYDIMNNHTPDEVSISVFKSWLDRNNQDGIRPESVQVQLLADGEATGTPVTLTSTSGWTYTWTSLPENNAGTPIDYSVEEVNVPAGYTSIVTDDDDGNLLMTNSYTPETTTINGMKTWNDNDNQDGIRPDTITVRLFADNVEVGRQEVTEAAGWAYSFTNLPVYANGQAIHYTVTEDYVPDYSPVVTDYDITNNHTPDEVSISVFKSWLDQNNQDGIRPEDIQVQLLADGQAMGTPVTLTSTANWQHTWAGLPENDSGTPIDYSVEEVDVPAGYTAIVTDNDDGNLLITNSYTPETRTIQGMKSWDDQDNQDGIRPEVITVNLLADGVVLSSLDVTQADDWKYVFDNLPTYAEGKDIVYTVTENSVEGYSTAIEAFDITNTRTPDETSVTITKSWLDLKDIDGQRPSEIDVQLLADGEAVGSPITITAGNNWTHTWSNLPQKAQGEDIVYTVEEVSLPTGYTATIDDSDHGNIILTNSYTFQTIAVSGEKYWQDDFDNQLETRPEAITVELLQNGQVIASQRVTPDETAKWLYTFENLDRFDSEGISYVYTLNELSVPDYTTTYEGNNIVNTYNVPHLVTIAGDKIWKDNNDELGKRPDAITLHLLVDGQIIDKQTVTADTEGNWHYSFDDLAMYTQAGEEILYQVTEVSVADYETSYDGPNIINTVILDPPADKPRELPSTGEEAVAWFWGVSILVLGTLSIFIGSKRRRDE